MKQILITGNNNSGKTMLSYFLAKELATGDNRCAVVSTCSSFPTASYLLPESKSNKSLGRLLSLGVIKDRDVYNSMWSFDRNNNVGLFCYNAGETSKSYPDISSSNLSAFLSFLKEKVDYIIIDTSNDTGNLIDIFFRQRADLILCVTTADMKGLAFRRCNNFESENVQHILFNNNPLNPYDDIRASYQTRVNYEMPYCKQLLWLYNGLMLDEAEMPRAYSKFIHKLTKELILTNDGKTDSSSL